MSGTYEHFRGIVDIPGLEPDWRLPINNRDAQARFNRQRDMYAHACKQDRGRIPTIVNDLTILGRVFAIPLVHVLTAQIALKAGDVADAEERLKEATDHWQAALVLAGVHARRAEWPAVANHLLVALSHTRGEGRYDKQIVLAVGQTLSRMRSRELIGLAEVVASISRPEVAQIGNKLLAYALHERYPNAAGLAVQGRLREAREAAGGSPVWHSSFDERHGGSEQAAKYGEFQSLFHEHASVLLNLRRNLNQVRDHLGPDPFADIRGKRSDHLIQLLKPPSAELENALNGLSGEIRSEFEGDLRSLKRARDKGPKMRGQYLSTTAAATRATVRRVISNGRDEPGLVAVDHAASAIERLVCLYSLHGLEEQILFMNEHAHEIRERQVLENSIEPVEREEIALNDLVRQLVSELGELAKSRRLVLRPKYTLANNVQITGVRRDLVRALRAIIENAIKYNWQLDEYDSEDAWVDIVTRRRGRMMEVEVDSWGVPITQEEVDKQTLFQKGVRGKYATRSTMNGSGYGLTDARNAARRHGGDVTLTSRPARRDGDPMNYDQAFRTLVSLTLPLELP